MERINVAFFSSEIRVVPQFLLFKDSFRMRRAERTGSALTIDPAIHPLPDHEVSRR